MLRRWRAAWPQRPRRFDPPWPQIAPAAPEWVPPFVRRASHPFLLVRRGSFHEPVWPASTWPPESTTQFARRGILARRGRFLPVPPAAVVAAAPGWVPAPLRARPRWLPKLRRGRFGEPVWPPVVYGTGMAAMLGDGSRPERLIEHHRRLRSRRFHEPPWPQVAAQPSVWRPSIIHPLGRMAGRPTRRGQFWEPVWAQIPVQPSVWRPDLVQQIARLAGRPIRRGVFHEPPWPPAAPAQPPAFPPIALRRQRPPIGPARRGRFTQVPPRPAGAPAFLRSRSRPIPSLRRRWFHEPPWPQIPVQPSVWRPTLHTRPGVRGRFAAKLRRGRWFEPGWPQVAQFIGIPPRWVEEAGGGSALLEGGAGGVALLEEASAGSGLIEGGSGGSSQAESAGGSSGLVEGSGGI